jgi:hypothetical protein
MSQMRKQDGGDCCHSRSSRDPKDHCVFCQARSRAADGGVIALDDLLPSRATKAPGFVGNLHAHPFAVAGTIMVT